MSSENRLLSVCSGFYGYMRKVLRSAWLVPVAFLYALFCWYKGYSLATIAGFAALIVLICFFCDKINNIYALIFFVAFFIKDIGNISEDITGGQMRVFVISAVAAGVALVSFAVKTFIVKKGIIEKGKLFYPLLIADAAFLLGGCIGRLNFTQIGLVFGFEFSVMLLYLLALNCTEDLGKFLAKTFIIGALFVSAEIIYVKWADGNIFDGNVINQKVFFFSAHSLNTGAIFLMLGIAGCYMLGAKRKSDVLYFLLALYFVFALFLSCCRTMLAISCLVVAAIYVLLIVFSPKKLNFLWLTVLLVAVAAIGCVLFKEKIAKFIGMILEKLGRGLNGRESLWPWCVEKFLSYPVFGYGFIASEAPPTVRTNLVLAHNTLLQWFTSLGVIGASMMSFFYIAKYKTLLKGFKSSRIFALLAIIGIELSGILDQAAAMDFFVFLVPIILISSVESDESVSALADGDVLSEAAQSLSATEKDVGE